MNSEEFLPRLREARWDVAARTFGSSHSTLIGLVSQWWVDQDVENSVLDGAPSFENSVDTGRRNAGWCYLLLCKAGNAYGVVEVEGTKHLEKLSTIGQYFASRRPELQGIRLGVLISYAYHVRGRGAEQCYPPALSEIVIAKAEAVSRSNPTCSVVLVGIEKGLDADRSPLRACSRYAWGTASNVHAVCYRDGRVLAKSHLWPLPL